MKIVYNVKKELVGLQNSIALLIARAENQQLTVNQIYDLLKSRLKNSEPPIVRGSILRVVQELQIKKIVFINGKAGKSNIYKINPENIEM